MHLTAILSLIMLFVREQVLAVRHSSPVHGVNIKEDLKTILSGPSSTKYSHNWAGAVLETSPPGSSNSTYQQVSAVFTVPTLVVNNSQDAYQAASVWVGIDGAINSPDVILQAGIDLSVRESNASYSAWYQWYPGESVDLELVVHAGDEMFISVSSLAGGAKGACAITNRSTGKSLSVNLGAPVPTSTLLGQSAEWVVEDYQAGGQSELVELVDFGEVRFRNCTAYASGGTQDQIGLRNATRYEMVDDNKLVADAKIRSQTDLTVQYQ